MQHCWHQSALARSLISGVEMVLEEPLAWLNIEWEHDQWAKQQYCSSNIFYFFLYTSHDRSQLVRVNIHQAAFHVRHQQLLLFGGVFVRQLRFMMQIIHAAKRIKNRQRRRTDGTSKSFPHEKCITMQSNLTKQLLAKVGIHCFTLTNWRVRPDRVCCLSESLPPSRCRHDCHRWGV